MTKLAAHPSPSGSASLENRPAANAELRGGEERANGARVTQLNRPNPAAVVDAPKSRRKLFIAGGAAVLLVAAGTWALHSRTQASAPGETKVTPPLELAQVDVETLQPRLLARSLPLSGSLSPLVQAT